MRRPAPIAASLLALLTITALLTKPAGGAPAAVNPATELEQVESFAFAIGNGGSSGDLARRYRNYDLVVLDGEEAPRRQVERLRGDGKVVLAYLSVGSIERWRWWHDAARRYAMEPLGNWPGERYADTSRRGFRKLIAGRVAPRMLGKGFSGLFLDNTDMIESPRHRRQRQGMYRLVDRLGAVVHARDGYLFAQNGQSRIGPMLDALDGWNREDVSRTFDFERRRYVAVPAGERRSALRALRRIGAAGKLTTATDYTRRRRSPASTGAVANACRAGAVPFVSNIGLGRIPVAPARCPDPTG